MMQVDDCTELFNGDAQIYMCSFKNTDKYYKPIHTGTKSGGLTGMVQALINVV